MRPLLFLVPVIYLILTFILLILPGDDLPKSPLFFNGFDKLVHISMFSLLVWLFCQPLKNSVSNPAQKKKMILRIAVAALAYGVIMEFVQKYFVPFRSFELTDIIADGTGCFFGFFVSNTMIARTKTP